MLNVRLFAVYKSQETAVVIKDRASAISLIKVKVQLDDANGMVGVLAASQANDPPFEKAVFMGFGMANG